MPGQLSSLSQPGGSSASGLCLEPGQELTYVRRATVGAPWAALAPGAEGGGLAGDKTVRIDDSGYSVGTRNFRRTFSRKVDAVATAQGHTAGPTPGTPATG